MLIALQSVNVPCSVPLGPKIIQRHQFDSFKFHIHFNVFRILRSLGMYGYLSGHRGPQLCMQTVEGTFWHPFIPRRLMDFILTSSNTLSIVDAMKHIRNRPPHTLHRSQLWVTLTSKQMKTHLSFLWQQYLLVICLVKLSQSRSCNAVSVCGGGWNHPIVWQLWTSRGVLSVTSKDVPLALWRSPLPLDLLVIIC